MKKTISVILTVVMLLMCIVAPNMTAYAANISLSVSKSTVQIGDSVTVTVSIPENVTGPIEISLSNDVLTYASSTAKEPGVNGKYISLSMGKYGLEGTNKVTLTFTAKTSGDVIISASHGDIFDNDTFEPIQLGSASAKVTVENKVVEPDSGNNNGGTTTEPQKSSDNSLSSLKLSNDTFTATLSPSFKYNVTKYTTTVGYNVREITISATPSHGEADIVSITGDGAPVKLAVGENTIEIIVKAENGVKAKYTIVVTRKAQETVEPQPSEDESQSDTNTPEVNEFLQYNGEQLTYVAEIPAERIPAGFESKLLVVNGQQMQGLSFAKADLKVLYLNNTNGAGSLYVYDEAQQAIYPFIKLTSEQSYVMVLLPDEQNDPAPEGFESCTFSIEGKGTIKAYRLSENLPAGAEEVEDETTSWNPFAPETFYAAPANASEFYLIYCMNDEGEKGWYMYDAVEETFVRYFAMTPSVPVGGDVSNDTELQVKYAALEKELNAAKMTQYIIIAVAAAIILILVVVIVVLVVKNRRPEEDFFDEYEDEDEEEIDDEETDVEEVIESESNEADDIVVDTMMEEVSEEDDEIEIEFYEMEPETEEADEVEIERRPKAADPTSKLSSKKEDDDDLEFIDFE